MPAHELGVVLDSFGQPVKEALQSASRLAFREVELSAVGNEVAPEQLSRTGRRDLRHYVGGLGLRLAALGGDLGGARFNDPAHLEQRLERTRRIIELAADLRVPVVTTQLGRVDQQTLKKGHLAEAIRQLADAADRTGTLVALETAAAEPAAIAELLREVNCAALGACYDPAALLIEGFDPLGGVDPLADRIWIARIRDALAGTPAHPGHETPIGQGQIDLAAYLAALEQAGYRGTAFLRRAHAEHSLEELADAKRQIENLLRG